MGKKLNRRKANRAKSKLGLPDLEHAKSAVLVSLRSHESQRSYRRSIEDFVCWYPSVKSVDRVTRINRTTIWSMNHRVFWEIVLGLGSIYCGFAPKWTFYEKGRLAGRLLFAIVGVILLIGAAWQIISKR
jgi:hypothetical protein